MYLATAERLFFQGRYLEVRILLEPYLNEPEDRVKQLYALALSKSGAPAMAENFFRPFYHTKMDDPENAGIMGGILKELFRNTQEPKYAQQARDIYAANFKVTNNYYTGINAASMYAITGKSSTARELAAQVLTTLPQDPKDFWEIVTFAETKLLLKDAPAAVEAYSKGRKLASGDWGKINIVYNQLWLMNHYFAIPKQVMQIFSPPKTAVFVGHMIDREGARVRFPASIEPQVKEAIAERIKSLDIQIGYGSLACGGDILFAEALTENQGEVNLFLPFPKEDFLDSSVRFAGQQWVDRFDTLEQKWPTRLVSQEKFHQNNDLFVLLGRTVMGAAVLRARLAHSEPYLITVLSDTDSQRKEGGTRDMLKFWPFRERYYNIDPTHFIQGDVKLSSGQMPAEVPSPWQVAYVAVIEFPQLKASSEELNKVIGKRLADYTDEVVAVEIRSGIAILATTSSLSAVQLAQECIDEYQSKTSKNDFRAVFHAAVVESQKEGDTTRLSGKDLDQAIALVKFSIPSTLMCSGLFAASLVLDPGKTNFLIAGSVDSEDGQKIEMYTFEKSEN